ncbi:uncharacterized protein STEHIDRAFT_124636 [Stereum hirsutum FP-91666 SS1]|uniref:uncharacterized protein n=1 Tax=Stereum hirsutum (strain FP-91666) TaxID=721885 RepID=UPI0004449C7A|nr:uncharacterized protein STEHIDRAFT_124636 [Stereum hirsutum FP-91666 SS1]EIM82548.1 hypothetical protein STEHIDRAFT_124636 [Stereum hirsutum FP-91666 SS1]
MDPPRERTCKQTKVVHRRWIYGSPKVQVNHPTTVPVRPLTPTIPFDHPCVIHLQLFPRVTETVQSATSVEDVWIRRRGSKGSLTAWLWMMSRAKWPTPCDGSPVYPTSPDDKRE